MSDRSCDIDTVTDSRLPCGEALGLFPLPLALGLPRRSPHSTLPRWHLSSLPRALCRPTSPEDSSTVPPGFLLSVHAPLRPPRRAYAVVRARVGLAVRPAVRSFQPPLLEIQTPDPAAIHKSNSCLMHNRHRGHHLIKDSAVPLKPDRSCRQND